MKRILLAIVFCLWSVLAYAVETIEQSTATYPLMFLMIDSTDHVTAKTGLTPSVLISKNGGSFNIPSGAVTELSHGWYKVAANATDSNTVGPLILHATGTGADPTEVKFQIMDYDDLDDIYVGSDLETAVNAIKTKTDYLPSATAGAAGGVFIAGSNAATTLATFTVTGATTYTGNVGLAAGLTVTQSTTNGHAISLVGNGTGDGISSTGGSSAGGHGAHLISGAGATSHGLVTQSQGSGTGSHGHYSVASNGDGVYYEGGASGDDLDLDNDEAPSLNNLLIVANNLDHLLKVAAVAGDVTNSSIIARMTSKTPTTPAFSSYDNTTDSLEALRDNVGTSGQTVIENMFTYDATADFATAHAGSLVKQTAGNVTVVTLPTIPTDWITATGIANNAIDAATFATDALAAMQTEANDALVANNLDHLLKVAAVVGDVVDSSVIARMTSSAATPAFSSFTNTTDSLEALRDNVGTEGRTVIENLFSYDATADFATAHAGSVVKQTANNVTVVTLPGIPANWITSSGITDGAITAADTDSTFATLLYTEAKKVMNTDTYVEPIGVPGSTVTMQEKISRIYQALINGATVTSTNKTFLNASDSGLWKKPLSDTGSLYTEGKATSP